MGSVDVWRQRGQVDLDDLIKVITGIRLNLVVSLQVVGHGVGRVSGRLAARRLEVAGGRVVVGEQRRGGADLSTHVADGGLTGS